MGSSVRNTGGTSPARGRNMGLGAPAFPSGVRTLAEFSQRDVSISSYSLNLNGNKFDVKFSGVNANLKGNKIEEESFFSSIVNNMTKSLLLHLLIGANPIVGGALVAIIYAYELLKLAVKIDDLYYESQTGPVDGKKLGSAVNDATQLAIGDKVESNVSNAFGGKMRSIFYGNGIATQMSVGFLSAVATESTGRAAGGISKLILSLLNPAPSFG